MPNGPKEEKGYRYDGLYYRNHIEKVRGISSFLIRRVHLDERDIA